MAYPVLGMAAGYGYQNMADRMKSLSGENAYRGEVLQDRMGRLEHDEVESSDFDESKKKLVEELKEKLKSLRKEEDSLNPDDEVDPEDERFNNYKKSKVKTIYK